MPENRIKKTPNKDTFHAVVRIIINKNDSITCSGIYRINTVLPTNDAGPKYTHK